MEGVEGSSGGLVARYVASRTLWKTTAQPQFMFSVALDMPLQEPAARRNRWLIML